jgi:hypothetical protein
MVKAPQQRNDEQAFTQSNKKKAAKFSPRGSLHRVMRTDLEECTNLQLAHYVTLHKAAKNHALAESGTRTAKMECHIP